jgi:hypothetical protein
MVPVGLLHGKARLMAASNSAFAFAVRLLMVRITSADQMVLPASASLLQAMWNTAGFSYISATEMLS